MSYITYVTYTSYFNPKYNPPLALSKYICNFSFCLTLKCQKQNLHSFCRTKLTCCCAVCVYSYIHHTDMTASSVFICKSRQDKIFANFLNCWTIFFFHEMNKTQTLLSASVLFCLRNPKGSITVLSIMTYCCTRVACYLFLSFHLPSVLLYFIWLKSYDTLLLKFPAKMLAAHQETQNKS